MVSKKKQEVSTVQSSNYCFFFNGICRHYMPKGCLLLMVTDFLDRSSGIICVTAAWWRPAIRQLVARLARMYTDCVKCSNCRVWWVVFNLKSCFPTLYLAQSWSLLLATPNKLIGITKFSIVIKSYCSLDMDILFMATKILVDIRKKIVFLRGFLT